MIFCNGTLCRTGRRGREGQIRQRSGREIKKLKDEFIKKHDQLNKLAVQIIELGNEAAFKHGLIFSITAQIIF